MKQEKNSPWITAAMLVPLADASTTTSWPVVLVLGAAAGLLAQIPRVHPDGNWYAVARWAVAACFLAELMEEAYGCWPGRKSEIAVPLVLLFLAAWASWKGSRSAEGAACVMRYGIGLVLGAIFLTGVKEIRPEKMPIEWRFPNEFLLPIFLLSSIRERKEGVKGLAVITGAALMASVVGEAVLDHTGGLYSLSKSINIFGVAEHFESVAAAAMTLGYFAAFTLLLSTIKEEKGKLWAGSCAMGAAAIYLILGTPNARGLAAGAIAVWLIIPWAAALRKYAEERKRKSKKREKRC